MNQRGGVFGSGGVDTFVVRKSRSLNGDDGNIDYSTVFGGDVCGGGNTTGSGGGGVGVHKSRSLPMRGIGDIDIGRSPHSAADR